MTLVVKDVPEELVERLRVRATKNGRTLEEELLAILDEYLAAA